MPGSRDRCWARQVVPDVDQHARDALQAGPDAYRLIFNAVDEPLLVHESATGAILDANERACDLFGYTLPEFRHLGLRALGTDPFPYRAQHALTWLHRARSKPQQFEWLASCKDGAPLQLEVNIRSINCRAATAF